MIRIINAKTYEQMSRMAADFMAAQIILKPDTVLGLATGTTPIGAYQGLISKCADGTLDFSKVRTVNLDEYRGIAPTHNQSYRYFMNHQLFDHVNIDPANTNVPGGLAEDPAQECRRYDRLICELGGIDLQLLGIGRNGHIGFNEPGRAFIPQTHVVDLTEDTIDANSRLFASADEVPRQAMTMGVGAIMRARRILLIANGENKAAALYGALFGPVTPENQASILQLHPDVTVIADAPAFSMISAEGGVSSDEIFLA